MAEITQTISTMTSAPLSTDGETVFTEKADPFLSGIEAMPAQYNAFGSQANSLRTDVLAAQTAADISETNAADSEEAAGISETNAAASAVAAESFDSKYLGAKDTAPTLDNQGNPLEAGALYFNTVTDLMYVYTGSSWAIAGSAVNGTAERSVYVATASQTTFSATYDIGYVDVYLNGSKLRVSVDFVASTGTSIVLTTGATEGDIVDIVAYGTFQIAVVEIANDLTPQLGGDLDLNGYNIPKLNGKLYFFGGM